LSFPNSARSLNSYMNKPKSLEQLAREAYCNGEEAVVELVHSLGSKLKEEKHRRGQNSTNSSFPSSRDLDAKKKNNSRKDTGRKSGGQTGHKGSTLRQVPNPDIILKYSPTNCGCGHTFDGSEEFIDSTRRQVFDIPKPVVTVEEYVSEKYRCPTCGEIHAGDFPEAVSAAAQYGHRLQAHVVYMMNYQLLPYKRTAEMFKNLFNISISQGTLRNIQHRFYQKIQDPLDKIKHEILNSNVVHVDETGFRSEGKRNWLHVASTDLYTFYFSHHRRGKEAMDDAGILPNYKGLIIHDFWKSYYQYDECSHSLCNAHHLRDLQGLIDCYGYQWAIQMKAFLSSSKEVVDRAKEDGLLEFDSNTIESITVIYKDIIDRGIKEVPPPPEKEAGTKGQQKKGKAWNLLNRFRERPEEILGFIYDFTIPFDNNQAERDIRMTKVKQKISGTFRDAEMAQAFCAARSYISTAIKQDLNVFKTVAAAVQGVFLL